MLGPVLHPTKKGSRVLRVSNCPQIFKFKHVPAELCGRNSTNCSEKVHWSPSTYFVANDDEEDKPHNKFSLDSSDLSNVYLDDNKENVDPVCGTVFNVMNFIQ